jgi:Cytochrome c oxidase subunit IV
MIRLSEEVLVFGRLAAFGLIVGTVYWFIAYEPAGTILLIGFGLASAVASAVLWAKSRRAGDASDGWPLGQEPARIPPPAYAPFQIGIGAGITALGLALGPLLALTGIVILIIGARYWLAAAVREGGSAASRDREGGPPR